MPVKVKLKANPRPVPRPEPVHFRNNILPPIIVLVNLRDRFEDEGNAEKFAKCVDALANFRTRHPDWDDFV